MIFKSTVLCSKKTGKQLTYGEGGGVLCVMDRFSMNLILRLFFGSIWTSPIIEGILKMSSFWENGFARVIM